MNLRRLENCWVCREKLDFVHDKSFMSLQCPNCELETPSLPYEETRRTEQFCKVWAYRACYKQKGLPALFPPNPENYSNLLCSALRESSLYADNRVVATQIIKKAARRFTSAILLMSLTEIDSLFTLREKALLCRTLMLNPETWATSPSKAHRAFLRGLDWSHTK